MSDVRLVLSIYELTAFNFGTFLIQNDTITIMKLITPVEMIFYICFAKSFSRALCCLIVVMPACLLNKKTLPCGNGKYGEETCISENFSEIRSKYSKNMQSLQAQTWPDKIFYYLDEALNKCVNIFVN